jgi:SAM-dependent methyltransferase
VSAIRSALGRLRRALARRLDPKVSISPHTPAATIDIEAVGLRDVMLSGWFDPAGNELVPGFPVDADDVVIDVGCGEGGNANYCAGQRAHVILVDSDERKIVEAARVLADTKAREVTPIVSDANPIPLADETATRVISTQVIEHVDDPAQFLRELVRVGRPGALYLLTVPDPFSEHLQQRLAPPSYFRKPNHVRIIEREAFAEMVEGAGLVIEKRIYDGFYRTMWLNLFWTTGVDIGAPPHPLLENWARTWNALLDTEGGLKVKAVLDEMMSRSQLIVARKPDAADAP